MEKSISHSPELTTELDDQSLSVNSVEVQKDGTVVEADRADGFHDISLSAPDVVKRSRPEQDRDPEQARLRSTPNLESLDQAPAESLQKQSNAQTQGKTPRPSRQHGTGPVFRLESETILDRLMNFIATLLKQVEQLFLSKFKPKKSTSEEELEEHLEEMARRTRAKNFQDFQDIEKEKEKTRKKSSARNRTEAPQGEQIKFEGR